MSERHRRFSCGRLKDGELPAARRLIRRVFLRDVAPLLSRKGVATFMAYVRSGALRERPGTDLFTLVARDAGRILGVIAVRDASHVSLLFVAPRARGRGVARTLVGKARAFCLRRRPGLSAMTVNASPNAVVAYERMGFERLGRRRTKKGIRFTPMRFTIRAGR
jgi:GNAT superfamily N-acetyltransferase